MKNTAEQTTDKVYEVNKYLITIPFELLFRQVDIIPRLGE